MKYWVLMNRPQNQPKYYHWNFFLYSKYIAGEFMFVDIQLEELSKPNFNGSTEAEPENKLVIMSVIML